MEGVIEGRCHVCYIHVLPYKCRLLCSQLPPELSSKLLLIANGGIEVGVL